MTERLACHLVQLGIGVDGAQQRVAEGLGAVLAAGCGGIKLPSVTWKQIFPRGSLTVVWLDS